jgi:protein-tyrosine kinase
MDDIGGNGNSMTTMQDAPLHTVRSSRPALDLARARPTTVNPDQMRGERVIGFDPTDRDGRPFTLLRSRILDLWRGQGHKLIGITSASPSAGKSFIACNVAASLATLPETRVALFDLDLRRGTVAENFGLESEGGIETYLNGTNLDLAGMARRIEGLALTVFTCAQVKGHSASLVAGDAFEALVAAMRSLPDDVLVLCDLPPTFANDDAKLICERLDGYVLVAEDGVTPRKAITAAVQFMQPSKLLGTILNRANVGLDDQYGYGSKAYRHYYE